MLYLKSDGRRNKATLQHDAHSLDLHERNGRKAAPRQTIFKCRLRAESGLTAVQRRNATPDALQQV